MSFLKKITLNSFIGYLGGSDNFLALDFGTTSIKAAIFKIEPDEDRKNLRAVILGVGKSLIKSEDIREEAADELLESCREAKKEAENMAGIQANKIIIGSGGQLIKIQTSIENYQRRNSEKPISLSEIKKIIQKIQWKILNDIRQKEKEECNVPEKDIKIISGKINEIKVDGYQVINPIGFTGNEVVLNILNIYTSRPYFEFFRQITKDLNVRMAAMTANAYAVLNAVYDSLFKANNLGEVSGIILDFGGKITDICLAQQGYFQGPKTISFGGDAFTKRLVKKLKLSRQEAEKLKIEYTANNLPKAIKQKVSEIFSPDLKVWLRGVEAVLHDFSLIENYPWLILIYGGGSLLPGIIDALEGKNWQEKFRFLKEIQVSQLQAGNIVSVDDKTELLKSIEDIPVLSLANLGLELIKKKPVMNSILDRVIRLM